MRIIRDSKRARAFPFSGFQTLSRLEAQRAGALAHLARQVGEVSGKVAEGLAQCLGRPARVTVLASPEAHRSGLPSGTPMAGVAVRVELQDRGASILALLPEGLLRRLTAAVFSLPVPDAAPDRSVFESLASILVLDVLAAVGSGADGVRLAALAATDDFSGIAPESKGDVFCLHLKITLGGGSDICTLLISERDLAVLGQPRTDLTGNAASRSMMQRLRLPVALVCGAGRIPCGMLAHAAAGDVLIPETVTAGASEHAPESVWLALRSRGHYRKIAAADAQGTTLTIKQTFMTKGERMTGTHDDPTGGDPAGSDKTEVQPLRGDIPPSVRDLPVEVAVEAARIELSIDEIASLSQGSIITLERPLSAEVTLTSAGSILAYGMLVSVDGEMGVQILKIKE